MTPVVKLISGVPLFWYPISLIHELGHYVSATIGGATEVTIVWRYGIFSETIRNGSKWPLMDVWMGPILGVLIPLVVMACCWKMKWSEWVAWPTSIACIGNGLYIGLGWLDSGGDPADMISLGTPLFVMLGYGLLVFTVGIVLLFKKSC